ncbi:MAG: class I SAM-dependent methyltransferase [Solirubrobacterales bacterium]
MSAPTGDPLRPTVTAGDPGPAPREWEAGTYHRVGAPMEDMGRAVLDRLPLHGDETVLDAGCGSGRVTRLLAERLPRGKVIAVDGSAAMVAEARATLGPLVDVRHADLAELSLDEPVDAILSTATFHWIGDHPRLFAALRAAARDGGRLAAQCGGAGNIEGVRRAIAATVADAPFAEHLAGWEGPWNFAGPAETRERLLSAGFATARCALQRIQVRPGEPVAYLRSVVLGSHLERLPDALRAPFVERVHKGCAHPLAVDYVRLDIDAVA